MTQNLARSGLSFGPGLGRDAVNRLSEARREPSWLLESRLQAWDLYEQLPTPTPQERPWKYTDITRLDFDRFLPFAPAAADAGAPGGPLDASATSDVRAGLLRQHNSEALAGESAERGVIFCSLDEAVQTHPDLLREYLMTRCVEPGLDKLTALHAAFWSGGVFLYVPRDVEIVLPFRSMVSATEPQLAVFPHALVVLEPNSRVALIEQYESPRRDGLSLCNAIGEFIVKDGAELRYVNVQQWDTSTSHFSTQRALLGNTATLRYASVGLGARLSKLRSEAILEGAGSDSEMLGLFLGERAQKFDAVTLQDHRGANSKSDLLFKSALRDSAQSVYYGLVHVGADARGSDANQENRNLLLSEKAKADSDPVLEILTSEVVRCGHGATVGPVDEEQLFYLQCRGFPRAEAERLLVAAFLTSVVQRIPVTSVRGELDRALLSRLGGG
jgi:Fe-S cluster assembly protein SufD